MGGGHEMNLSGSGKGQVKGTCKHGNGPSDSIKFEECFVKKTLLHGESNNNNN
jgi:hypothetical protein